MYLEWSIIRPLGSSRTLSATIEDRHKKKLSTRSITVCFIWLYGAPGRIIAHFPVGDSSGSRWSWKIAPGNFFEPSDEPIYPKQRTIKKPPLKSRGLFYCMVRLKGFEPLTARFVAEYSIQLSYRRIICRCGCEHALSRFMLVTSMYMDPKLCSHLTPVSSQPRDYSGFPALQITSCNLPPRLAIAIQFCSLQN